MSPNFLFLTTLVTWDRRHRNQVGLFPKNRHNGWKNVWSLRNPSRLPSEIVPKPATLDNGDTMAKEKLSDTTSSTKPSGPASHRGEKPGRGSRKRPWLALGILVAVGLLIGVSAVLLRPDIVSLRKSSRAYSILHKIVPDTYLERFTVQPKRVIPRRVVKKNTAPPPPPVSPVYRLVEDEGAQHRSTKKWVPWYIIQLRNGEKIVTQKATETNGIITVLGPSGKGKSFSRASVMNVKKVLL